MKINLTLTIHRGNCDFASLKKMVEASRRMEVDKIRFNCFVNYRDNPNLRGYKLTHPILVDRFYSDLAELFRKHKESSLEFEVSENFGNNGIGHIQEFMDPAYRDQHIGVCNAGWRLFAIVKIDGRIVVVGCVDRLGPVLGQVIEGRRGNWHIEWNTKKIYTIRDWRWRESLYGCWGGIGATDGFNHPKVTRMIFS